jgi:hypothetical protein
VRSPVGVRNRVYLAISWDVEIIAETRFLGFDAQEAEFVRCSIGRGFNRRVGYANTAATAFGNAMGTKYATGYK